MFFIFYCNPEDVVEETSIRASCFDGGIRNVRVSCDGFSSKSVSTFIVYNTCVGFYFVERVRVRVTQLYPPARAVEL
jgi:hypothetical protein